jgi:hypothetical protein
MPWRMASAAESQTAIARRHPSSTQWPLPSLPNRPTAEPRGRRSRLEKLYDAARALTVHEPKIRHRWLVDQADQSLALTARHRPRVGRAASRVCRWHDVILWPARYCHPPTPFRLLSISTSTRSPQSCHPTARLAARLSPKDSRGAHDEIRSTPKIQYKFWPE